MQVWVIAKARATIGGPGCVMRIASKAASFHWVTTVLPAANTVGLVANNAVIDADSNIFLLFLLLINYIPTKLIFFIKKNVKTL
ncbi:hypothetical protein [Methyloglobulus morosus]|uniref:hypothetical protein n=1 Tax=Methyloglobulus morosus TaxID=1410681 RepID=UPI00128F6198|nr:hypothetical protein [Methyloglobulus morosus]